MYLRENRSVAVSLFNIEMSEISLYRFYIENNSRYGRLAYVIKHKRLIIKYNR